MKIYNDIYLTVRNILRQRGVEGYNLEAKLVKKMRTNGRTSISLPAGIYVVVSGNHSKKVIIK